jgi:phosphatidate phosphatase APP1
LYEFLDLFFEQQQIPKGPLLLRDLGLRRRRRPAPDYDHKLEQFRRLLKLYSELPFILIGDSGERDPELFSRIVRDFPGRVLATYVREVTSRPRDAAVQQIAAEVRARGVPMILAADSVTAAEHAASSGFIDAEAVLAVRGERLQQQSY